MYWQQVYLILKVLAWEICNIRLEFAKKIIIQSQITIIFYVWFKFLWKQTLVGEILASFWAYQLFMHSGVPVLIGSGGRQWRGSTLIPSLSYWKTKLHMRYGFTNSFSVASSSKRGRFLAAVVKTGRQGSDKNAKKNNTLLF